MRFMTLVIFLSAIFIQQVKGHLVNNPPVIPNKVIDVPFQSSVGFVIGTVTATDPDVDQVLQFSIDGGNDGNAFVLNELNEIVLNASLQPLAKARYDLLIKAVDNGSPAMSTTATFTIYIVDESTISKTTEFEGSDTHFGSQTAVHGNIALVGDVRNATVSIFYKNDNVWTFLKTLTTSDQLTEFGRALAVHDDLVFVGAARDGDIPLNSGGTVHIFKKDLGGPDNWGLLKKLKAPDEKSGDLFGTSLSVYANTLLVGAKGVDYPGATNAGAVYLFEKDQDGVDNWGMQVKLSKPGLDLGPNDAFGEVVKLSNNQMAVMASGDDDAGSNTGCVYVFGKNDFGAWVQQAKLTDINSGNNSLRFALDDTKIILGNDWDSPVTAHLYELNSTNQQWSLTKSFIGSSDAKAMTLSIVGNTLTFSTDKDLHVFHKDWGGVNNWGKKQLIKAEQNIYTTSGDGQTLVLNMPYYEHIESSPQPRNGSVAFYKVNDIAQIPGPEVNLSIRSGVVQLNQEIELPLTVEKFKNISSAQLTVDWDPDIAEFVDVVDPIFGTQMVFDLQQIASGKLTLSWSSPNDEGVDLEDGSALFALKFKGVGAPGAATPISIEQSSTSLTTADREVVQVITTAGAVSMKLFLPVLLIAPEMATKKNAQLLVPVSVKNFTDLIGVQFTLAWNPDVISYKGVEQFTIPGLDRNSFGEQEVGDGTLTLSWTSPALVQQTVPDNTNLFFVKFNVVGDPGAVSYFEIRDGIEIIGADFVLRDYETDHGHVSIDQFALIGGTVKHHGHLTSDVLVKSSASSLEYSATTTDGSYSMSVGAGFNYLVTVSKPTDKSTYTMYLNAADLAAVHRHILKTDILTDPLKLKAADVNKSATVTTFDKVLIEGVVLGLQDFQNQEQWRFLPVGYQNADPFAYPVDQVLNDVIEDVTLDFDAIHLGDVFDSQSVSSGREKPGDYTFKIRAERNESNGEVKAIVEAFGFDDIAALQASFQWDTDLEFLGIDAGSIAPKINATENSLRLVWDEGRGTAESFAEGSTFFVLRFRSTGEINLRDKLSLSNVLRPEAYSRQLHSSQIKLTWSDYEAVNFGVSSPYPNPFSVDTKLTVALSAASEIHYLIFDMLGSEIYKNTIQGLPGVNTIQWSGINYDGIDVSKGMYLLKVRVGAFNKSLKISKE